MRKVSCWLVALPLVYPIASLPAAAAVYRCSDVAGKVTYQAQPCPDESRARSVNVETVPAARPLVKPPRPKENESWGILGGAVALHAPAAPAPTGQLPAVANTRSDGRALDRPALPEVPRVRMSFELLSVDGRRLPWTNTGPKDGKRNDGVVRGGSMLELAGGAAVVHPNGIEAYALQGNGGTLAWMPKGLAGPKQELRPPARLPELSWGSGMAWDTRKGVLAIVSTGGEGFFYRYDTRSHTWLDARSLQNRDLLSLALDPVNGTYVAISQEAELVTFNADGAIEHVRPLADRLAGLSSTFDRGIPHADGFSLAARDGVVAIVNVRKASVTHIWTYEQTSGRAQLTYKAIN